MPPSHDVQRYLGGLWLLAKGDARGLSVFDISDRGVLNSFWAFAWCLPGLALYAMLRRIEYVAEVPDGEISAPSFYLFIVGNEILIWALSILILVVAALIFQLRPLMRTLIVFFNWSNVPVLYVAYAILFPLALFPLESTAFDMQVGFAQIILLVFISIIMLLAIVRALRTVMGGHPFKAIAIVVLLIAPTAYVTDLLEKRQGIFISYE